MKKVLSLMMVFVIAASILSVNDADARRKTPIEYFNDWGQTNVYIGEITNSTGDENINLEELRKNLDAAFFVRTKYDFKIVKDKSAADIIITVDVQEYKWAEHDFVNTLPFSIKNLNPAADEHYARMQALITVKKASNNRKMWQDKLKATISNATMTEQQSYGMVSKRIVAIFIRELLKPESHDAK